MPEKIKAEHLALPAYIYIRQSTLKQVFKNKESRRVQYKLVDKAKELGWPSPVVIDEDLGRSGSGGAKRPGFSRLLQDVIAFKVGAVFSIEASRLSRNDSDWGQLLRGCAFTGTLIIDQDGVYDPNNVSDCAFLGMKGALSQYEVGLNVQRTQQAREEKAGRGEYYTNLPAGYVQPRGERCEMDPDKRTREAIYLLFKKFRELGSIAQVVDWFRSKELTLPLRTSGKTADRIVWRPPVAGYIRKMLLNPIYAGVYAYGRSRTENCFVDGQFRKSRKNLPIEKWKIFLKDQHPGYISWDDYLANRQKLQNNQSRQGGEISGAAKCGKALLQGLLRCRKCGRKLYVRYSGSRPDSPRYQCQGQRHSGLDEKKVSFSGAALEALVEREVLRVIEPAAIAASRQAERLHAEGQKEQEQSVVRALEQAEYEADRCFAQFNQVDPNNRLVASTLEARWNTALEKAGAVKQQLEHIRAGYTPLTEKQQRTLEELAENLPEAWRRSQADIRLKKRIARTVIKEIVVDIDDDNQLHVVIHWFGGKHTEYALKRRRKVQLKSDDQPDVSRIIRDLVATSRDQDIARVLNLLRIKTESKEAWRANRVQEFRRTHNIPAFDEAEYARKGWVNLQQAAEILHVHPETVRRLIKAKMLKAEQVIKYSPWMIAKEQLQKEELRKVAESVNKNPKMLARKNPNQLSI